MNGLSLMPVPLPRKDVAERIAEELKQQGVRYGETHSTLLVPSGLVKEVMERGGAYAKVQTPTSDSETMMSFTTTDSGLYQKLIKDLQASRVPVILRNDRKSLGFLYSETDSQAVVGIIGNHLNGEPFDDFLEDLYRQVQGPLKEEEPKIETKLDSLVDKDGNPLSWEPRGLAPYAAATRIEDLLGDWEREEDRQRSAEANANRPDAPWPPMEE